MDTAFDETDAIVLDRFFEKHADKVGKELLSITKADEEIEEDELSSGIGKKLWNTICSALIDTNLAALIPAKSELSSDKHEEYRSLMARYQHRDTTSVKDLFQAADTPKVCL